VLIDAAFIFDAGPDTVPARQGGRIPTAQVPGG